MAQIRYISIASDHPGKTADFFKKAFGFREVARHGLDPATPMWPPGLQAWFLPTDISASASSNLRRIKSAWVSTIVDFITSDLWLTILANGPGTWNRSARRI